jgi:hypothetical protein
MFIPVKRPFHPVQHGGNYQAGGSVTKMAYLLFSQAPCDNTSSAQQKAKDQEKLFNEYY